MRRSGNASVDERKKGIFGYKWHFFGIFYEKIQKKCIFFQKYFAIKNKSIIFAENFEIKYSMRYNELEKILKRNGCYPLEEQMGGHPLWYSPKTGKRFKTSNHKSEEIPKGTLAAIKKDAGII